MQVILSFECVCGSEPRIPITVIIIIVFHKTEDSWILNRRVHHPVPHKLSYVLTFVSSMLTMELYFLSTKQPVTHDSDQMERIPSVSF